MSETTVLVVASLNADHIVQAPRIPSPGETIMGHALLRELGGKGGNQAIAAARLGAPTAVVASVGTDDDGDDYLAALRADGIDTSHVSQLANFATGRASITVDDDGTNSIVVIGGANEAVPEESVSQAFTDYRGMRVVVGQMEASVSATATAFRLARKLGILTLLNTAPATDRVPELLPWTDIVVANEIEFKQITGHDSDCEDCLRQGAQTLINAGVRWVVVTAGEEGSTVLDGCSLIQVPAEQVTAVDTTAAGDAFVGAVAAHLAGTESADQNGAGLADFASTGSLVQACRTASRVAALVVTRRGAHPSLPALNEIRALY